MLSRRFLLCVGLVLVLGAMVRFTQLGSTPTGLYWDEVAILVDAKSIAHRGLDMHGNSWLQALFPSYGDYKLPVYIWLASVSVWLFGVSDWAVRFPSAVAGLLTILAAGLISNELFSPKQARQRQGLFLATAGVVALAPWSIIFSRTGFEAHLGQFFLTLSIWSTLKIRRHFGWSIAAVFLGALAVYSYYSVRFIWPVVFVATILLFHRPKRYTMKAWLGALGLPLLGYWLLLQPLHRSPLYLESQQFRLSTTSVLNMTDWRVMTNQYRLMAGNGLIDKAVYHPWWLMGRELARNFSDTLSLDFLFFSGDSNLRHGTGRHGLFLWVFIIPFGYGWYTLATKHSKQAALLLIWWLAAVLPAAVPETTPHALRSLSALVPLALVIGWGSWQLIAACRRSVWPQWSKFGVAGLALLITGLVVAEFVQYYFRVYPLQSASAWQTGYADVARQVWIQRERAEEAWFRSSDGRFYLWFLAYVVPATDFSNLEFHQYQLKQLERIQFGWPPERPHLSTVTVPTLLVTERAFLDTALTEAEVTPREYTLFQSQIDKPFASAMVGGKP